MKSIWKSLFFIFPALLTNATLAETELTGLYLGAAINKVSVKTDSFKHDRTTGFGMYGGYHFNDWFGLDGGYFTSGDFGEGNNDAYVRVLTLSPKFSYSFHDQFSVYFKMGLASMTAKEDIYSSGYSGSYSGVGVHYGIGLNREIFDRVNIRVSYDVTNVDLDDSDYVKRYGSSSDFEVKQIALGLHYQF